MSELERKLERHFHDRVKAAGGIAIKVAPTLKGLPDRAVLFKGNVFFCELKTDTGERSEIQKHMHKRFAKHGMDVATLYGKDQIDEWLDAIFNERK